MDLAALTPPGTEQPLDIQASNVDAVIHTTLAHQCDLILSDDGADDGMSFVNGLLHAGLFLVRRRLQTTGLHQHRQSLADEHARVRDDGQLSPALSLSSSLSLQLSLSPALSLSLSRSLSLQLSLSLSPALSLSLSLQLSLSRAVSFYQSSAQRCGSSQREYTCRLQGLLCRRPLRGALSPPHPPLPLPSPFLEPMALCHCRLTSGWMLCGRAEIADQEARRRGGGPGATRDLNSRHRLLLPPADQVPHACVPVPDVRQVLARRRRPGRLRPAQQHLRAGERPTAALYVESHDPLAATVS